LFDMGFAPRAFTPRANGRACKVVTWHNDGVDRAVLAVALVACGARTDLGGARPDASVSNDASSDVVYSDVKLDAPQTKCPPHVYVDDEQSSTAFAIDDAAVYSVLDPCQLWRTTKDDTTTSTFSMGDCAGDIVVDDLYVYWTSAAGRLMRHAKDGASSTDDLGCAALNGCPGNVHVRAVAKDVVVLVDGFRPVAMSKKVASSPYPLIGSGVSPPAPVHYVFVDDTRAYWNNDIRVFSAPLDASAPPLQYATASTGLAINSTNVFWTSGVPKAFALQTSSKGGGAATSLSVSQTSTPLVASDAFIYGGSLGITRQSTSASTPEVIVPNVHPLTLALDDDCIYFAEKTDNGRRIARAAN
jgi:hypothetical protein